MLSQVVCRSLPGTWYVVAVKTMYQVHTRYVLYVVYGGTKPKPMNEKTLVISISWNAITYTLGTAAGGPFHYVRGWYFFVHTGADDEISVWGMRSRPSSRGAAAVVASTSLRNKSQALGWCAQKQVRGNTRWRP